MAHPHDLGRAIVALRARVTAYIVPPLLPPLGIAKKEIMQMREAAVSRRVPRSRRCAPLNAGPFAVSCNVRIPKGFPATCVRSLSLHAKGISEVGLPGGRERGRQRGFGLRGRDTRTGIMWAAVRNEYLLPFVDRVLVRIFHQRDSLYSNTVMVGRYGSQSRIMGVSKLMGFALGIGNSHE